ncbi:MAG: hypothetical protein ACTSUU_02405 [Candidatus Thorarchaeota archaeon]
MDESHGKSMYYILRTASVRWDIEFGACNSRGEGGHITKCNGSLRTTTELRRRTHSKYWERLSNPERTDSKTIACGDLLLENGGLDVERVISHVWELMEKATQDHTDMVTPPRPCRIVLVSETSRRGGELYDGILSVGPTSVVNDWILSAVVAREFLIACDTKGCVNPAVWEALAQDMIHVMFHNQRQHADPADTEIQEPPSLRKPNSTAREADRVAMYSCLDALKNLIWCVRLGIRVNVEDYPHITKAGSPSAPLKLTGTDIALIRRLLRIPPPTFKQIASSMGRSVQWVSQRVRSLERKQVLLKRTGILLYRISIRRFKLLVAGSGGRSGNVVQTLSQHPFTTRVSSLDLGSWRYLADLEVPDNSKNIEAVKQLAELLESRGHEVDIFDVAASGESESLNGFSIERQSWVIPWTTKKIELDRIRRNKLAEVMPKIETPHQRVDADITNFDLQVAQSVLDGAVTIDKVRARLRAGQARVAGAVHKLREGNVTSTRYGLNSVGLSEKVIISSLNPEDAAAISAWAATLPYVKVERNIEGAMVAELRLPPGGTHSICEAVSVLAGPVEVTTVEELWSRRTVIPIDEWDEQTQEWRPATPRITRWLKTAQHHAT